MTERDIAIRKAVAVYPAAPLWKRLPVIRHIRAIWLTRQINQHYALWAMMGSLPVNSDLDYAIRDAVWRGEK